MSYMFEVHCSSPANPQREDELSAQVSRFGGHLTYREEGNGRGPGTIALTYEFDDLAPAKEAAAALRKGGEHVEGPMDYGP